MRYTILFLLLLLIFNAGCDTTPEGELQIEDLIVGTGETGAQFETWRVNYTAHFVNGEVFDDFFATDPFDFVNDSSIPIEGWNQGIQGMKVGGKRRITMPPHLAFGSNDIKDSNGNVVIPKNSTVIFDVTLLELPKLQVNDLIVGTGNGATINDILNVAYVGKFTDGEEFDSGTNFSFSLGVSNVIQGWHDGLAGMKVGGKRELIIPPHLGYGSRGTSGIPPNTTLVFEVELLSIQ